MKEQIVTSTEEDMQKEGEGYYPSEDYVRYEDSDKERERPTLSLVYPNRNPEGGYRSTTTGNYEATFLDSVLDSQGGERSPELKEKLHKALYKSDSGEFPRCDIHTLELKTCSAETNAIVRGILKARDSWYDDIVEVPTSIKTGWDSDIRIGQQFDIRDQIDHIKRVFGKETVEIVKQELIVARQEIILEQVRSIRDKLKIAFYLSPTDEDAPAAQAVANKNLAGIPDPDEDPEGAIKWYEKFDEAEGTIIKSE